MEKKLWSRPQTMVQGFEANEYVAGCGDTEYGKYKFTCNAGGGAYGGLYVKNSYGYSRVSNGTRSYHACNDTHETGLRDEYKEGIFDPDTNHNNGNEVPCLIWYHNGRYQGHASKGLTRDEWEIVKS